MDYTATTVDELPTLAATFLAQIPPGVVAFYGEMGVGKTTFIKSICRQLGVETGMSSPTFGIVNTYFAPKLGEEIFHFDFYRFESAEEIWQVGVMEYFESGQYCFVEWPEKIGAYLPADAVKVHLQLRDKMRVITF